MILIAATALSLLSKQPMIFWTTEDGSASGLMSEKPARFFRSEASLVVTPIATSSADTSPWMTIDPSRPLYRILCQAQLNTFYHKGITSAGSTIGDDEGREVKQPQPLQISNLSVECVFRLPLFKKCVRLHVIAPL